MDHTKGLGLCLLNQDTIEVGYDCDSARMIIPLSVPCLGPPPYTIYDIFTSDARLDRLLAYGSGLLSKGARTC